MPLIQIVIILLVGLFFGGCAAQNKQYFKWGTAEYYSEGNNEIQEVTVTKSGNDTVTFSVKGARNMELQVTQDLVGVLKDAVKKLPQVKP
jgi:hypothetical protein